jgi:hypothetical protein
VGNPENLGLLLIGLASCSPSEEPTSPRTESTARVSQAHPAFEVRPDGTFVFQGSLQDWNELGDEQFRALVDRERARLADLGLELGSFVGVAGYEKPIPDGTKPWIVTRDHELWVLPGAGKHCYTVKDHEGNVLAERIDEARLRTDFSYLHNRLHPEYLQFYDAAGD